MNSKLAKKFRKAIGNITNVAKTYLKHEKTGQIIVDPKSTHGVYKRVKKARLTSDHFRKGVDETVVDLLKETA